MPAPNPLTDAQLVEIQQYALEGRGDKEIGEILGRARSTIYRARQRIGVAVSKDAATRSMVALADATIEALPELVLMYGDVKIKRNLKQKEIKKLPDSWSTKRAKLEKQWLELNKEMRAILQLAADFQVGAELFQKVADFQQGIREVIDHDISPEARQELLTACVHRGLMGSNIGTVPGGNDGDPGAASLP